jgi:exonuclease SbcD
LKKILHTSDWHIGHKLYDKSRDIEHKLFFQWLYSFIKEQRVELLLVSGDIFDSSIPSNSSLKIYYDFLISLQDTECKSIIITAGNHDSPSTLDAPKEILKTLNIYIFAKAENELNNMILPIKNSNIILLPIPFLRDKDIRVATAHENIDNINQRYRKALIKYYCKLADECKKINGNNIFIAMGHLFATGTKAGDSESTIYVGGVGDISADDFPDIFDYIALGHLHKAQKVGGKEHIRYSGSPIPLSFSEAKQDSKVILLNIEEDIKIEEITVPKFRDIVTIKGNLYQIQNRLKEISATSSNLTPWVEIIIKNGIELEKINRNLNVEILKISIDNQREFNYMEKDNEKIISLSFLTPEEVFERKCKEEKFDLAINSRIKDIFYEILSEIREE